MKGPRLLAVVAVAVPAFASSWNVARSDHFEVWSDAPVETARVLDIGLERLHSVFVRQVGIGPRGKVRVICFASPQDYADYRIRPGAAGFSLTGPDGEYIVITTQVPDLRIAAHEYSHLLIHSSGWNLPEWLAEGISEVVSSVQFGERFSLMGGDIPGRSHLLKTSQWMTPAEFFSYSVKGQEQSPRETLFYSQSWAVAEMLIVAPAYAPQFPALVALLAKGSSAQAAIQGVYGASPEALFRDVRERQTRGLSPMPLPAVSSIASPRVEPVSAFDARAVLAGLRHAAGDADRAEAMYRELAAERPGSPDIPAELGLIALERKDPDRAVREWRRALSLGLRDAALCYRYAVLAEERGLGESQVRPALERALAIRPDFDEAHFRLGLIDKNTNHPAEAVAHFRAMSPPPPERAWRYYSSLADALIDLKRRAEAKEAAIEARKFASTDVERARARDLAWLADSELSVEIVAGPDGRREFRTVRVPVNAPPRNPFIEAGEDAQSVEAKLVRVECPDESIRVVVSTPRGPLTLTVPDPSRVQIRNAGGEKFEFTCGPQQPRPVLVEYTTANKILRGLELR